MKCFLLTLRRLLQSEATMSQSEKLLCKSGGILRRSKSFLWENTQNSESRLHDSFNVFKQMNERYLLIYPAVDNGSQCSNPETNKEAN